MFPRLHLILLATASLAPPITAQGTALLQDVIELPRLGGGEADHATVALNANGDAFVTWHARTAFGGPHQVEGVLVRRGSGMSWQIPAPADTILLGDPSLALLSPFEECTKPDVVALGNDFLVVWPRNAPFSGFSQLEAALVVVPPAGPPVVDQALPGQGWVVDANVVGGDAGVMPDLSAREAFPGTAAVVYASETFAQAALREYEVRATTLDFSVSPPVVAAPTVVASGVPVDNTTWGPAGGRVLPDLVEDDFGHFVLAYESFELSVHHGLPTDEGHIVVHRLQENAGAWSVLETHVMNGLVLEYRQRRPNLATSRADGSNTVSISWFEQGNGLLDDIDTRYGELDFLGGNQVGTVSQFNYVFPNLPKRDHSLSVPLHSPGFRTLICSRWFSFMTGVVAFSALPAIPERPLPNQPDWSWRPAADLLEIGAPGARNSRLIAVSYEGNSPVTPFDVIFLQLFRR